MTSTWNYDDDDYVCGPKSWPGTINGKQQSPIDLKISKMNVVSLRDPLVFINYEKSLSGEFVNTGHSVKFVPDEGLQLPEICGGMFDQSYRFMQFHYHWSQSNEGSEHTIGGLRYPAELHLVHQGVEDASRLAVLGIFLQLEDNQEDRCFQAEYKVLSQILNCSQKTRSAAPIVLAEKLPECQSTFVRYNGSLTTPPCSENVIWTVFTDPVSISQKQLNLLRSVKDAAGSVIRKNYRPVQRWNERKVMLLC